MRKTNVKRHIRKRNGKAILVSKHRRLIQVKKQPVSHGTISTKERKIFNYISSPVNKREYGGAMDFAKKGNLEQFSVKPGDIDSVELPDDYEVLYHTHPDRYESPPSPDDLFTLIRSKSQQAEVIFRDGIVFVVAKTPQTRYMRKLSKDRLRKMFEQVESNMDPHTNKGLEQRAKRELEKLGFHVSVIPKSTNPVRLPIKPVEIKKHTQPKKRDRFLPNLS